MIDVSKIVSKRLAVHNDFAVSLCYVDFCLSAFPLSEAVVSISNLSSLFDFFKSGLGFFQRKILEFHLGINSPISYTILINEFTVFIEDAELIKISMAIQVHWHLIQSQFQSG